ncbi:MAG: Com family DNA-binding transcriptional regulator, partial [Pirellulaceae bacterium]|nr:Com family DNA-binding transcriptional regulator [Pirellulaceae bacterium]
MALEVHCGQCARRFAAAPALAGKQVRCPGCGGVLVVPAQEPAAPLMATIVDPAPVPKPQPAPQPQSAPWNSVFDSVSSPAQAPPPATGGYPLLRGDAPPASFVPPDSFAGGPA